MGEAMRKMGVPHEILSQMDCNASTLGNNPLPTIAVIDKMDELLSKEQKYAVIEKEGCSKGGKRDQDCKAFGEKYAGLSLTEKLALVHTVENMTSPVLNEDGSFTVTLYGHQNGVHSGKTTCSCGAIKKLKQPFTVSKTYCGCCAGHFLHHYQSMLGVALQLKEINSSPLDTGGEMPCQFTFEVKRM
jgi:hypothetical protein